MRIAIQISTGRVREMQTNAKPGDLTKNLVAAGIPANDIEEREVTQEEYAALIDAQDPKPKTLTVEGLAQALVEAGALSAKQVDDAKKPPPRRNQS